MAKLRVNIQLDESTKKYCQEQSDRLGGIGVSGFVNVAIAQYRQQQESMVAMSNMGNIIAQLKEVGQLSIDSQK